MKRGKKTNAEAQAIFEKTKSIDEVLPEILYVLHSNGLFGSIYIEDGVSFRVADCALSPYHAGALAIKSSASFQRDYKTTGGIIYKQFRKGMYDAAKALGVQITMAEPMKEGVEIVPADS